MVPYTPTPSTLKPQQVAVAMVEAAVIKHQTRLDLIFFKAVRVSLISSYARTHPLIRR